MTVSERRKKSELLTFDQPHNWLVCEACEETAFDASLEPTTKDGIDMFPVGHVDRMPAGKCEGCHQLVDIRCQLATGINSKHAGMFWITVRSFMALAKLPYEPRCKVLTKIVFGA